MKSWKIGIAFLAATALLTGCQASKTEEQSGRKDSTTATVSDVLEAGVAQAQAETAQAPAEADAAAAQATAAADTGSRQSGVDAGAPAPEVVNEAELLGKTEGIDIDLTAVSSTMVYSQVYDMMYEPENYVGKIVKMSGMYSGITDQTSGNQYHVCIIQDATACCSQGIEFVPVSSYSVKEAFPQDNEIITVVGVFDIYDENGYTYCTLRNAEYV